MSTGTSRTITLTDRGRIAASTALTGACQGCGAIVHYRSLLRRWVDDPTDLLAHECEHLHEVDHSACVREDHIARGEAGEDCPLVRCLTCVTDEARDVA